MANSQSSDGVGLTSQALQRLRRWNTPAIYNGWEQVTESDSSKEAFNLEETRDFMPHLGAMVGYAVTCVIEPSNSKHAAVQPSPWIAYRNYLASLPGPKIIVVQDLDKPRTYGAGWGEVNANIHRALGCVGAIIDGGVRDIDEMTQVGFKTLARRLCVGHAAAIPVRWDCDVEVFGTPIKPGQLIHADQHGFLSVPPGEEGKLLAATEFMDRMESEHLIPATQTNDGESFSGIAARINHGAQQFTEAVQERFRNRGEWS